SSLTVPARDSPSTCRAAGSGSKPLPELAAETAALRCWRRGRPSPALSPVQSNLVRLTGFWLGIRQGCLGLRMLRQTQPSRHEPWFLHGQSSPVKPSPTTSRPEEYGLCHIDPPMSHFGAIWRNRRLLQRGY